VIYVAHYFIDNYLGKEEAQRLADQATEKSQTFF